MEDNRPNRRLSAILAADVVGYSKHMGADQEGTLAALRQMREELFDPIVSDHRGNVVKRMGDGWIVEFPSISDAVACAVAIQSGLVGHHIIKLRIGIHIGEVVFESDDVFGDGVNVAARLEALAKSGQVLISDSAHNSLDGKAKDQFSSNGKHQLKNISRQIAVWSWSAEQNVFSPVVLEALPLPEKPSIAVLPFNNMSGDPEQEYFVDGMVEDILTTLSKIPKLFVIARNSSFQYKGKSPDVRAVGRELGVRYVVEGSVRKAGNRVRVTAQLIDCLDGTHIWADKFDGELDDVFELQDRLTKEIVTQLDVNLTEGEQVRIWRNRSGNPLVYEQFIRGREFYTNFSKQTHGQAKSEFEEVLTIDPEFTPAIIMLGFTLTDQARFGWVADREQNFEKALKLADDALAFDPHFGEIYTIVSYAKTFLRLHDEAIDAAEKAILLSSNNANAFHMSAMTHIFAGNHAVGKNYELQYSRLSPIDMNVSIIELARAHYHLGEFEEAREGSELVLKAVPHWLSAQTILTACYWRLKREADARAICAKITGRHPKFSVDRWAMGLPYRVENDLDELMDPLLSAGLKQ